MNCDLSRVDVLCPKYGYRIPFTCYDNHYPYSAFPISIVGGGYAGKTTYLNVLIHELEDGMLASKWRWGDENY